CVEFVVRGLVNEPNEFDDALLFLSGRLAMWLVLALVGGPILAEIVQPAHPGGPHDESIPSAQPPIGGCGGGIFDERIKPEELAFETPRHSQSNFRERAPRRRYSDRSKGSQRHRFACLRGIKRHRMQVERRNTIKRLIPEPNF